MGTKITVDGVVAGGTGRLLFNDPIMSKGSLVLWDPSHSLGGFSGIPLNGGYMPNIAWRQAQEIIGSGTEETLGVSFVRTETDPSLCLVERSGNGGIHGLYSHTGSPTGDNFIMASPRALIQDYIHANTDADMYFSAWFRVTRAPVIASGNNWQSPFHKAGSNTNTLLFWSQGGVVEPLTGANILGRRSTVPQMNLFTSGQTGFVSAGTTGWTGTKPTLGNVGGLGNGVGGGTFGLHYGTGAFDIWAAPNRADPMGMVLERFYAEDLAVSGRTYTEVDALDLALYNAAHNAGGKWFGDTYTNPATFP